MGVDRLTTSVAPTTYKQAAGRAAQLMRERYRCRSGRRVSFTSVGHWRGWRTRLHTSLQSHRLEEARYDVWAGKGSNHIKWQQAFPIVERLFHGRKRHGTERA